MSDLPKPVADAVEKLCAEPYPSRSAACRDVIRRTAETVAAIMAGQGPEPIAATSPFERVPQHAWDPGFGPVPPRPKVEPLFEDNASAGDAEAPSIPADLSKALEELKGRCNHEADFAIERAASLCLAHGAREIEGRDEVIKFFASVIKSGEPWTEQCETALQTIAI